MNLEEVRQVVLDVAATKYAYKHFDEFWEEMNSTIAGPMEANSKEQLRADLNKMVAEGAEYVAQILMALSGLESFLTMYKKGMN